MDTLNRLWRLAEQEAQRTGEAPNSVFGEIGLYLERPLSNFGYDSTPVNTSTFASTGGDGVHYGLLHLDGEVRDNSPVVMTVPMMFEAPNLVVGESLVEFLCLGGQVGYFDLEQLVYNERDAIDHITHPQSWADEIKGWVDQNEAYGFDAAVGGIGHFVESMRLRRSLLDALSVEFLLKPWDNIEARLHELNEKYLPLLALPAQAEP